MNDNLLWRISSYFRNASALCNSTSAIQWTPCERWIRIKFIKTHWLNCFVIFTNVNLSTCPSIPPSFSPRALTLMLYRQQYILCPIIYSTVVWNLKILPESRTIYHWKINWIPKLYQEQEKLYIYIYPLKYDKHWYSLKQCFWKCIQNLHM